MNFDYSDFSMSLKKHPFSGDVVIKYDVDSVRQALTNLFMTNPGEKLMDPQFGIGLRGLLFENWSPVSKIVLQKTIQNQINFYEPRVILEDIKIDDDPDSNSLEISVYFYIRGRDRKLETLTLTFERIR